MTRKKKHAAHQNHERWMVSYADFVTLLFAFFVVMFASSQSDKAKAQQLSEAVKKALEEGQVGAMIAGILGGATEQKGKGNAMLNEPSCANGKPDDAAVKQAILSDLLPSLRFLSEQLKDDIAGGKLQIRMQARGLVVSLTEAAFFPSGEDTIAPQAYPMIEKIAEVLRKLPNPVRLEGHTDSVPIHNSRFQSNWELSAARGVAMLNLLTGRLHIEKERLAIAGYADNFPLDSNDTEAGRARNRRVDLVILNKIGVESEPSKEPAPAKPQGGRH